MYSPYNESYLYFKDTHNPENDISKVLDLFKKYKIRLCDDYYCVCSHSITLKEDVISYYLDDFPKGATLLYLQGEMDKQRSVQDLFETDKIPYTKDEMALINTLRIMRYDEVPTQKIFEDNKVADVTELELVAQAKDTMLQNGHSQPPENTQEAEADPLSMDILTYFKQFKPDDLIPLKREKNAYYVKGHDSIKVKGGKWYWRALKTQGSTAYEYLMRVEKMSEADAKMLLSRLKKGHMEPVTIHENVAEELKDANSRLIMNDASQGNLNAAEPQNAPPQQEATSQSNKQQISDLLKAAETGIKEVFESNRYKNYLATMSKFHNYSFRNVMLILQQKPNASNVAGYATWKKNFNRQVQKGEKCIAIIGFAPKKLVEDVPLKDSETGKPILDSSGHPMTERKTNNIPYFCKMYVYDISQTDGEPLPTLTTELNGSVTGYQNLMDALRSVSKFPIAFEDMADSKKGYCNPIDMRIAIKAGMSEAQTLKTAIHEITHADLHAPESDSPSHGESGRRTKEVEAESVAYVVCSHYGLDTSDYSFGYLAAWSSDKELKELQGSLERIQKQASDLIDRVDNRMAELQREQPSIASPEKTTAPLDGEKPATNPPKVQKVTSMQERMNAARIEAEKRNSAKDTLDAKKDIEQAV